VATVAEALTEALDHHRSGDFDQAERLCHLILQANPNHADAHHLLGVLAYHKGRFDVAALSIGRALALNPRAAVYHYNLGLAQKGLDQMDQALASFQEAVRLQPDFPQAWNNVGLASKMQDKLDEEIRCYRQALRFKPDYVEAHMNLGNAQRQRAQLAHAAASYQQALRLKPDFAEAYSALGTVLQEQGYFDESMACYQKALHLKPDLAEAHWNRSLLWLLLGALEQGWPEYEWRWTQTRFTRRPFSQPLWDGSDLGGRTILLDTEQGLGDTLHFIRYVPLVKQRGANVIVECQPPLVRLLSSVQGIDCLLASGSPLPAFDVQAPVASLPGIFRTCLATIPRAVPYLHADCKLVEHWKSAMCDVRCATSEEVHLTSHIAHRTSHFLVGIAWQGDPTFPGDRQRSIPLARFAPLAKVQGIRLISLQKGPGIDQLHGLANQFPVHDLGDRLDEAAGAFMDTAAIMKNLDLVISSDTAVAHLAGALGVRVWLALARVPDWRWLLQRPDSPWYPTMHLFRQSRAGDWDEVFERMAAKLKAVVSCELSEKQLLTTDN